MSISIIAAASTNNIIGRNGKTPWTQKNDLKFFHGLTLNHHIIMGRKTFESIGHALKDRVNIVLSRKKDLKLKNCIVVNSLEKALDIAKDDSEVFIIGGTEVFCEALKFADKIYLTRVHAVIEGDAFFPELAESEWDIVSKEDFLADDNNEFDYSFLVYVRESAQIDL